MPLTRKADSSGCARWTTQRPGSDRSRVAHPVSDASNADLILISFSDTSNSSLLDLYVNNDPCACGTAIPSHSQSADHYPPYTRFTLPIRGSRQKSNQWLSERPRLRGSRANSSSLAEFIVPACRWNQFSSASSQLSTHGQGTNSPLAPSPPMRS